MKSLKHIFLSILFVLLIVSPAWGASLIYYVDSASTAGGTCLTNATSGVARACVLPSSALTLANAVAPTGTGIGLGHIIYVLTGNYTDNLAVTNANFAGGSIIGVSNSTTLAAAAKGQVILTQAAAHTIRCNQTNVTVKNLSFTGTNSSYTTMYLDGTNFTGDNLYAYDSGQYLINASNATGLIIKNSKFAGAGFKVAVNLAGTTAGTFTYNIFSHSSDKTLGIYNDGGIGIKANTSGTINFFNNILMGADGITLSQEGSGVTNIENSIIIGSSRLYQYTISRAAGTLNLLNNLLMQSWFSTDFRLLNGTINTDIGNIKTSQPYFVKRSRTGIIVPCVDDPGAITSGYVTDLATELSSRGMKGTYFLGTSNVATNVAAVQALINGGVVTLGTHGYTHTDLSMADDATIFTLTGCTVTNDRTGTGTITIAGGGSGTISNVLTSTLTTIRAGLVTAGCTVANTGYGATDLMAQPATLGECLKTATAGSTTLKLLIDPTNATGYFKYEVATAKLYAESLLTGYTARVFGTPYGTYSTSAATAIKNAGYLGNRISGAKASANFTLKSLDIFNVAYIGYLILVGASDAETITNTKAICEVVSNYGMILFILGHSTSEITIAQWRLILDTIKEYSEIIVTDADTALTAIRSTPWSLAADCTDSGATATCTVSRTWIDASDFHLQAGSPAINAGLNLCTAAGVPFAGCTGAGTGTWTDYDGNTVISDFVSIGVYQWKPKLGMGF